MKAGHLRKNLKKYDEERTVLFQQRNGNYWTVSTIRLSDDDELEFIFDDSRDNSLTVGDLLQRLDTYSRNIEIFFVDWGMPGTDDPTYYYIHDYHYENADGEVVIGISYIQ